MEKRQAEILAPAGSWASMKAAVAAGADAVYMGGTRFGARAYADNPDEKGLLEAIDYVHLHGRRPVSYTHLDVYKRQACALKRCGMKTGSWLASGRQGQPGS